MSRIVDIEPLLKKYDGMNEGTEFSPIHFINDLMVLEQLLFTEKEELLRVSKGAVKARQGRFVIYDVDWLKENFYTTEEKIYGQPKQPCIEDYPTCTECEHYDSEKHYCPRFCQVIKDTLAEAQPCEDVVKCDCTTEEIAKSFIEDVEAVKEQLDGQFIDAVSREAVLHLYKTFWRCFVDDANADIFMNAIRDLPSVTPQASEEDIHREREQAYMLGYEDASKKFRTQPSEDCISILNRIMEYTYGMLTAEKYGLQHLIKSMMDEMSGGGKDADSN